MKVAAKKRAEFPCPFCARKCIAVSTATDQFVLHVNDPDIDALDFVTLARKALGKAVDS